MPEAVRRRPGMYIGSIEQRGLHNLVLTVAEWSASGVLVHGGGRVDVTLTPDGGVCVADDGPGVPFAAATAGGAAEVIPLDEQLSHICDGAPARLRAALIASGSWLCVAGALSRRLTAEVRRDGVRWVQEYVRGTATAPPAPAGPLPAGSGSGTVIAFRPDPEIFTTTTEVAYDVLADRLRELAFLNRTLTFSLTDGRLPGPPRADLFHFPAGVGGLVSFLDAEEDAAPDTELVTVEAADPRMGGTVEAALRWRGPGAGSEVIRSYANCHPTPEGGTHVAGLRDGLAAALTAYARAHRLPLPADGSVSGERIGAGLTAVVSVRLDHPEWEGATHGRLGNTAVRPCVAEAVRDHLTGWLEAHPEQAAALTARLTPDQG
ncbi:MAG: DNA gyrase subunit B [Streptomyces sp.]|nr:DNA gyrase subunit B [Streptomyces sp.]